MKRIRNILGWLAVAAAALTLFSVCSQSSSVVFADPPIEKAAGTETSNKKKESWDILLMQGKRLGYVQTVTQRLKEAGRDVLQIESIARLSIRRGDDSSQQLMRVMSVETPEGRLIRYESQVGLGPQPISAKGEVKGDRLEIETTGTGTAPKQISIAWSPDDGSPAAVEQSLQRKPMKPGERRTIKSLMPEFLQVAAVRMTAKDYEPCKLLTGVHNLLRIESVTQLAGNQKLEQTLWVDRTGDVLKSYMPAAGGIESYRASKAEATDKADAAQLDLLPSMFVKIDRALPNGHRTKQITYRVHLDGADPASVFVNGPTQAIKSIDANTADVTVHAVRPGQADGNPDAPADPPTDDERTPNFYIQSDDPLIVADAQKAAGDEQDPWRVAVALERFVNREVKNKNFSQAFATASDVAKSREGDCTEHAVFLAALCRARGIPARVAMGLVYMNGSRAFGYHMWTEAYIDKRWIPIDGTLALGGIGAAHLKIAQSSLKDATAYSSFLPVTQVLGRLKISVVDVK
jgi:hypothetical protein